VFFGLADSAPRMIRDGFLTEEDRGKLVALARDGSAASRVTRRANALVLLDGGWSCQEVAAALLMDDDTIRGWHKLFEQRGIEGLTGFDMGGSAGFLSTAQEDACRDRRQCQHSRCPICANRLFGWPVTIAATMTMPETATGSPRRRWPTAFLGWWPSALAVVRLIASSNLLDCTRGGRRALHP
jgi:hypothetical protein